MNQALRRVCVIGTGSFLPNEPVPNDRLEAVLGPLDAAPPRVKSFVQNIAPKILENTCVKFRHFAIDPVSHDLTHTYASLAEEAAKRALDAAGKKPEEVDLLILSSPSYDNSTPPTSTLLQERLGIEHCAEMEIHSNCSGVGKAMQVAYDALRLGRYRTALVSYAQLSSVYLRSSYLNQTRMTKTQAALRYILADGAGSVLLEAKEDSNGRTADHEILGTYVESVGAKRTPGMFAGGGVADLVSNDKQIPHMWDTGSHHLDQDFNAVNHDAVVLLAEGCKRALAQLGLCPGDIDHFVLSIPGRHMYDSSMELMAEFGTTPERARFRGEKTGYCGGASVLLHFDEMVRCGEIRPGQTAMMYSVESSKWMSAGFAVRW